MASRTQLPGMDVFLSLRNHALRLGVILGALLSCVFTTWLLIANRVPQFEVFAGVRNLAAGAAAMMLVMIPVLRFWREPVKMFVSGLTSWTLLTLTYRLMEMRFSLLETRMGAFHIFMLGGVTCGFLAAFRWVFQLCLDVRQRYIAQLPHVPVTVSRPPVH